MSGTQQELEDSGEKDDSLLEFVRGFSKLLKEPEAIKRLQTLLLTMESYMQKEPDEMCNFNEFRGDEQGVLERRKQKDLLKRYNGDIKERDKRIAQLENELKQCRERTEEQEEQDYHNRISQLENELKQCRERNEELENFAGNKEEQEEQEYYNRFKKMEDQYEAAISKKDEELENLKSRIAQLENELKQCRERTEEQEEQDYHNSNEELENFARSKEEQEEQEYYNRFKKMKDKYKAAISKKDEELEKLKRRLAEVHEKHVKKDQRKVEDATAANRPSEVKDHFYDFFDHARMDAIGKMQKEYGSEEDADVDISYPRLACIIFEAAYEQTTEVKEAVVELFKQMVKHMIELAPKMGQDFSSAKTTGQLPYTIHFHAIACSPEDSYPTDVMDAILLSLKETGHSCSLESMEEGVMRKIEEKWNLWLRRDQSCKFSFSHFLLSNLKDYIEACMRLSWRMVTQVPPMELEYHQSTTSKDIHKIVGYHSSPEMCLMHPLNGQDSAAEIACYLWPALFDEGGKLIRPAEVLCKKDDEMI